MKVDLLVNNAIMPQECEGRRQVFEGPCQEHHDTYCMMAIEL